MTIQVRMTWLFTAVVCAVAVAGCGSASTGRVSPDAVRNKAESIAGPNAKVAMDGLLVKYAGHDKVRVMWMVVACKPAGGCEVVAPDGASYPDLQAFVDDTKLLEPGDRFLGNANITSPGKPERDEAFTKRDATPWTSYVGGGGALLALLMVAVWLATRTRRRRRNEQKLPSAQEAYGDSG